MNRILISTLTVAMVALAGCASKPKTAKLDPVPECTFPDSPKDAAPMWVCDNPVEGVAVSAVGAQEKSAAGPQFMKDQAVAAGRVNLAQQMRVHVTNMIKQFVETTGAASSETVDKVNSSVSKLITNESIAGSRLYRTATSPKGTLYVLVGMDPKNAAEQTQNAIRTSMKNERAQWQQFKSKLGQDELAAEIAKQQEKQ